MFARVIAFSALIAGAAAVSSGAAMQAASQMKKIREDTMNKAIDLFKKNAEKEGVKGVRGKASSLLQGKMMKGEDLEAWVDSNSAVDMEHEVGIQLVKSEMNEITAEKFEKTLKDLEAATHGSRYIGHEGNKEAVAHITKICTEAGMKVKEHKFDYTLQRLRGANKPKEFLNSMFDKNGNVACYKRGSDPELAKETVLIGAHYDSVNWRERDVSGAMKDAPGMDDNGSGTTALIMIANALKNHSPKRSMLLVGFNAEEEGLLGSKAFVRDVVKDNTKDSEYGVIKYALIADEIAFPGRKDFDRKAIFETKGSVEGSNTIVDTMAHSVSDPRGAIAGFEVNKHGFGSDHMSFLDAGIPAMLLIERDDEWRASARGHSGQDTIDDLSMSFGATMTRLLLRTSLKLASPKAH